MAHGDNLGDPQVTAAIPDVIVQVRADSTAVHPTDDDPDGELHGPGDKFRVAGPTAIALVQAGAVDIVGSVHPDDPEPKGLGPSAATRKMLADARKRPGRK